MDLSKLQMAAGFVADLAHLAGELGRAIAKGDTARVDEILSGDLQTTVRLKVERLETIRALEEREATKGA